MLDKLKHALNKTSFVEGKGGHCWNRYMNLCYANYIIMQLT